MKAGDVIIKGPPTWKVEHVINDQVYSIRMDNPNGLGVLVSKVTLGGVDTYELSISKRGLSKTEAIKLAQTLALWGGAFDEPKKEAA